MTVILSIDPGAFLGWCVGRHDSKPVYGVHRLPKGRFTNQALALEEFLIDKIKGSGVEKVYAERPIMPKVTSFDAMMAMAGKAAVIGMTCARLGIDIVFIDMATWRSEFGVPTQAPKRVKGTTERRKWVKAATIARCEALGYAPEDDNSADAIGLWACVTNRILAREAAPTLFESDLTTSLDI